MKSVTLLLGALAMVSLNVGPAAAAFTQGSGRNRVPQPSPPPGSDRVARPPVPARPPEPPRPIPPVSQPAPQGSFRLTCRDIRMDGAILRAVCRKADFAGIDTGWETASLDTSECFNVDAVSNENGSLDCSPPGSYRQTCRFRRSYRSQDALGASCRMVRRPLGSEQSREARLESVSTCRSGTIQNLDGILACDRR
jgi:hypothetical protein